MARGVLGNEPADRGIVVPAPHVIEAVLIVHHTVHPHIFERVLDPLHGFDQRTERGIPVAVHDTAGGIGHLSRVAQRVELIVIVLAICIELGVQPQPVVEGGDKVPGAVVLRDGCARHRVDHIVARLAVLLHPDPVPEPVIVILPAICPGFDPDQLVLVVVVIVRGLTLNRPGHHVSIIVIAAVRRSDSGVLVHPIGRIIGHLAVLHNPYPVTKCVIGVRGMAQVGIGHPHQLVVRIVFIIVDALQRGRSYRKTPCVVLVPKAGKCLAAGVEVHHSGKLPGAIVIVVRGRSVPVARVRQIARAVVRVGNECMTAPVRDPHQPPVAVIIVIPAELIVVAFPAQPPRIVVGVIDPVAGWVLDAC